MPRTRSRSTQVRDESVVTEDELKAGSLDTELDGTYPTPLTSTDNGTSTITFASLVLDQNIQVQEDDLVVIAGTGAAGTYTVDAVTSLSTLTVKETLPSSVGGTATLYHPTGSSRVGVDNTGWNVLSGSTLQEVLDFLDVNLNDDQILVTQTSHGFSALDPIVPNGDGTYTAADASTASLNAGAVVLQVIDANTYIAVLGRSYLSAPSHGYTGVQFLQDGGGVGATPGTFTQAVYAVHDANTLILILDAPIGLPAGPGVDYITPIWFADNPLNASVNVTGTIVNWNAGFTNRTDLFADNAQGVEVLEDMVVEATATIYTFENAGARRNVGFQLSVNGTPQGPIFAGSYIRDASGHEEASDTGVTPLSVSAGDIIGVRTLQLGSAGTTEMPAGNSQLYVKRIG